MEKFCAIRGQGSLLDYSAGGLGGPFVSEAATAQYPPDLALDPKHLEIALTIDIEAATATGKVSHTVCAITAGSHTLVLDAVDLDVRGVSSDDGTALDYTYDGTKLTIRWPNEFEAQEVRTAAVDYSVERPVTGLFFSERSRFAATDHETERARHWLPCIDLPSARPTLSFKLRAKADLEILANGAHINTETHSDGTKTAHWQLDQPCPSYLTCFAIGDFIRVDEAAFGDIPVSYFTTKDYSPDDLRRSFGRTGKMLAWMTKKLGYAFPYPKYYQFAVPGVGGAMENISLVSWDAKLLLDESAATEWTRLLDIINVHEMGHSYFGDLLVCRDFAHAWLKESWATYMEHAWLEDACGENELRYELERSRRDYFGEADNRYTRPIVTRTFDSSWQMYDHHLYPGGALRLHLLRKTLGDAVFWDGVRNYVETFAYQTVETDDFRRTMERSSGRSLGKFFDQWLRSPGYPKLKVTFEHDPDKGFGTFTLEQTQMDADKGIGTFDFDIEVAWRGSQDSAYRTESVSIERAKHSVMVPMAAPPVELRIDPKANLPVHVEFDPGNDKLATQLVCAPDITGRIHAGQTLLKTGRVKGVAAVAGAWSAEGFYGVRVFWAEALGMAGSRAAVELLTRLVGEETDGQVLEPLMRAAGKYRDTDLAAAVAARLDEGDLPHRARQAAFQMLGLQRDSQWSARLAQAAETEGFNGVAQIGGLLGLGELKSEEALEALKARLPEPATPELARPSAVAAVACCAEGLPRERRAMAAEWLTDLLRDRQPRVQMAAVAGLQRLGATEASGAIEAFARGISRQDRVTVLASLRRLLKAAEAPNQAVSEAVTALKATVRELQSQLERLRSEVRGAARKSKESDDV